MQFFPVSFAIIALFLLAIRRGAEGGLPLAIALLPFGMAAFANLTALGNLSLPAAEVVAGCTIGLLVLDRAVRRPAPFVGSLVDGLDRSGWPLALLALYGLFSATVLVRLFERELYVFPLNPSEDGLRVSRHFGSEIELLTPGATNVSQMLYLAFSIAFFFLCRAAVERRGSAFLHEALATAAWINVALGAMDAAGLDGPLALVRTAKYALLNLHEVQGMARVIGGFPEASGYGGFSAVVAAYFAAHYLFAGGRRSAVLALSSAVAALASFSSTAYLGLGIAGAGLLAGAAWTFLRRRVPARHLVFLHAAALGGVTLAFAVLVTGLPTVVVDVLDQLLFSKVESVSALERGAWAAVSMNAFAESHYLGVGVGSVRGNGLLSVYLGSVGVPGTLLLLLFFLRVLTGRGRDEPGRSVGPGHRAIANAARLAVVTKLATAAVAATTPDPGLLMMLCCGILAARPPAQAAQAVHAPRPTAAPFPGREPVMVPAGGAAVGAPPAPGAELEFLPTPFIDLGRPRLLRLPDILLPLAPERTRRSCAGPDGTITPSATRRATEASG